MDVFHYLETCRFRYNLDTADIWNGFLISYEDDYLRKIREALDERELTLVNLCCDYAHPWHEDPETLKKQHAVADNCLKAAEILGAKTVRFDLGVWSLEITDEQVSYISAKFREYARRAGEGGYKVCVENHWGASRRVDVQRLMLEAVNDPNYGLLLHLGNWEEDSEIKRDANDQAMARHAVHMHCAQPYCERAHEVIPAIYAAGYTGVWGTEHHSAKHEYDEVAYQLAAMRRELCKLED
ncbi:MAG: sugar phosphate isomerase/epimerase [Clostridiales bacterium]|nr:sugar phosphate isomerase/epimerase [Clostridiales bacterium]